MVFGWLWVVFQLPWFLGERGGRRCFLGLNVQPLGWRPSRRRAAQTGARWHSWEDSWRSRWRFGQQNGQWRKYSSTYGLHWPLQTCFDHGLQINRYSTTTRILLRQSIRTFVFPVKCQCNPQKFADAPPFTTVGGSEIRHPPVQDGSLSHYLRRVW